MDKLSSYWKEISVYLTAPVQICLIVVVAYFIRRILRGRKEPEEPKVEEKHEVLEPMKKRDFYLEELKEYDGLKSKRILIGVNGKVFDVTRGKNFYGPDGPYGVFAGHDASRGLATFSVDQSILKDEYDDLSDLNAMQMDSLREWEMQFMEKYDLVGKLLRPGQKPAQYEQESETEDEDTRTASKKTD